MRIAHFLLVPFTALLTAATPTFSPAAEPPSGPLSPDDAVKAFKVPGDLEIELVLSEPIVRQPVFMNFDERGRLWVVQYLQYPNPAGLKMLSKDNYWRAVYDKVPPPPPHHFRGHDKITVHEDTDGDGTFDKHKTFLDGLNIVTSVARGRAGVWVLNPPYLLFYADADGDDVPDGDPVVHLSGFGLEDTHSVVNSLRWGPDGWLYAAQGSTVTGHVVRPGLDKVPVHSMGQLIWRYHPETKRYEIFAEGGGNAFGVEIDRKGRVYSGHNGGNTRGFQYVQGGYFQKGFSKHGPLSNPYAFGYFPAMKHHEVQRFTHTFLIYDGGALPEKYRGKLFGVAPLLNHVVYSDIQRDGSSYRTTDLGHPVTTTDKWFRPVDIKHGPDGALYVADWYENQVNHYRNHEGQIDKLRGRIYRLKAKGAGPAAPLDLSRRSTEQLIALLEHPNQWYRRTALRLLADRKDPAALPPLRRLISQSTGQLALEALWAINASGGFNEQLAAETLRHDDPQVRLWTVRLLCDARHVSPEQADALVAMARSEPDLQVRSQLACSAKRLPAGQGLPLTAALLQRDEDAGDIHLPLLLWWAIESKARSDRDKVLALFEDSTLWDRPLVRDRILSRLMRRYASAGTRDDLLTCAQLLRSAPGPAAAQQLMKGFEEAYQGRSLSGLPEVLIAAIARSGAGSLALEVRLGRPAALQQALQVVANPQADARLRVRLIQVLGEVDAPGSVPVLLKVLQNTSDVPLLLASVTALQRYDDPAVGEAVIARYNRFPKDVQAAAHTLLSSRASWSLAWVAAIGAGAIDPANVPPEVVAKLRRHRSPELAQLVTKLWGEAPKSSDAQLREQIDALSQSIEAASGDPYRGKALFNQTCGKCHTLFGQGGAVGPDLTTHQRTDLPNMLLAVTAPSAEIREGYENYVVVTTDGRALSGLIVDQDKRIVIVRGSDAQNIVLRRDQIDELEAASQSLMPEKLLDPLDEQQIRDLFAYLRSTQPLND